MKPVDALNAILNTDLTSEIVCKKKPVGINKPATFIVDTTKLCHPDDLKADDLGSWVNKGKPSRLFDIVRDSSGIVYGANNCSSFDVSGNVFRLTRMYYHHKGTPEFKKTIFYVCGKLTYNSKHAGL